MSEGIFGKNANLAQRLKDRIAFHANEHRHTYEIGKGVMDALVLDLLADFRDAGGVCEDDRHEEGVTCGSRIYDPDHPDAPCSARSKKPEGVAVELADAVIRIADLCGHLGIDLDAVIAEKMAYNAGRPYKHGKRF